MNFVHYIFNGQYHHLGWIRVFDEETSLTKKVVTDAFNLFSRWQMPSRTDYLYAN